MKTITAQLPTVLGSISAMLVAFLSLLTGTPPTTCLLKAAAAYVVFAGVGVILRYAVVDSLESRESEASSQYDTTGLDAYHPGNLDMIVPGTSVADLLSPTPELPPTNAASEDQQAA